METVIAFFFERVVKPMFLKQATDEARLTTLARDNVPAVMDYLEGIVPASGFLFGRALSIADFGITSPFITAKLGGFAPDVRYKKLTAYLGRVVATPVFAKRVETETAEMAALRG